MEKPANIKCQHNKTGEVGVKTERKILSRRLNVHLTAGDYPADLGARNLEEDAEGRDAGVGVQHGVERPHQETCRVTTHREDCS